MEPVAISGILRIPSVEVHYVGLDQIYKFHDRIKFLNGTSYHPKPMDVYVTTDVASLGNVPHAITSLVFEIMPLDLLKGKLPAQLPNTLLRKARTGDVLEFYFDDQLFRLTCDQDVTSYLETAELTINLRRGPFFEFIEDQPKDLSAYVFPETRMIQIGKKGLHPVEWSEPPKFLKKFNEVAVHERIILKNKEKRFLCLSFGLYENDTIHILWNETHLHIYLKKAMMYIPKDAKRINGEDYDSWLKENDVLFSTYPIDPDWKVHTDDIKAVMHDYALINIIIPYSVDPNNEKPSMIYEALEVTEERIDNFHSDRKLI